jgi:hypothetical protein
VIYGVEVAVRLFPFVSVVRFFIRLFTNKTLTGNTDENVFQKLNSLQTTPQGTMHKTKKAPAIQ